MITKEEHEETRTRYNELLKRQYELEVIIPKNRNDEVISELRKEYREVKQEISNILNNNILKSIENGSSN